MPIYTKKLTPAQHKWMKDFETLTGFECMYQDDIDTGEMTFLEVAIANVNWYRLHTEDMAQQAEADLYNGVFSIDGRTERAA